jgi:MoaA/NifB/PqqE/SkfB family radical SAM enzyme
MPYRGRHARRKRWRNVSLISLFPRLPPVYVIHFLTHRCNLACEFCCDGHNRSARTELDLSAIERFYGHLVAAQLSITGGEPTLRHDLAAILRAALRARVHSVSLNTNGLLPNRLESVLIDALGSSERPQLKVNISIDGFRDTHDRMRGLPGSFDAAFESCERLLRLREPFPGLSLRVNTVVTSDNRHELLQFRQFLRFRLPGLADQILSLHRTPPGGIVEPSVLAVYREATRLAVAERGILPKQALLKRLHTRMYEEIVELATGKPTGFVCPAGGALVEVTAAGEVLGCEVLPKPEASLGMLLDYDYDLSAVLRTPQAAQFRERILREHCACTFECAHLTAATIDPVRAVFSKLETRPRLARLVR